MTDQPQGTPPAPQTPAVPWPAPVADAGATDPPRQDNVGQVWAGQDSAGQDSAGQDGAAGDATPAPAEADLPTTPLEDGACLVAIAFADPLHAQEALLAAMRLKAHGHLSVEDAAIVSRAGQKVRIQQTRDMNPADGAMSGGWWGLLAGLFAGNPLIGGALGAALGGLWAKLHDIGISDPEMKRLGESLGADEAALFLLLRGAHRWHAMAEARRFPGRVFHTTLSPQDEADLAAALAAAHTAL